MRILSGMSCFAREISGRQVCVWSDNKGAEAAARKGAAKAFDHNALIHTIWAKAAELKARRFYERSQLTLRAAARRLVCGSCACPRRRMWLTYRQESLMRCFRA